MSTACRSGWFRCWPGDLDPATDLAASLKLARRGATLTLGLRAYFYLALAQYLALRVDDVLLTAEQGFSAATIHSRRYELPLLHLAAGCVPAGRGAIEEAERHARLAEEAAADLDYGQERLYAAMARALVCQAAADYLGMADALGYWQDAVLHGGTRLYGLLWRPLLAEALIARASWSRPPPSWASCAPITARSPTCSLAWLKGWLAEQRGAPEEARLIYARGEDTASRQSPVYTARLLLAHGRLLRRTGNRKDAVERLRQAVTSGPGAARPPRSSPGPKGKPAACHLPGSPRRSGLS